jgi:hypothetical protein
MVVLEIEVPRWSSFGHRALYHVQEFPYEGFWDAALVGIAIALLVVFLFPLVRMLVTKPPRSEDQGHAPDWVLPADFQGFGGCPARSSEAAGKTSAKFQPQSISPTSA